jgi:hypothetical protein
MADYIPLKDQDFATWVRILFNYILGHFAQWGTPDPTASLKGPLEAFEAALTAALDHNRGKVDILAKNETKKALKKEVRTYVRAYLINNPAVTDEDKTEMGLPIHKTTHTPIPVPNTSPQLTVSTETRRRLTVLYRDEGSGRRGKPAGVHGVEVKWAILDAPPSDISELANSSFDTKPPLFIEFAEHERGKKVFLCGRWEISREGEKGPFGDIVEAVIP